MLDVCSAEKNTLVVMIDDRVAEVALAGGGDWQEVVLSSDDFKNYASEGLPNWDNIMRLKLSPSERLKPGRGESGSARVVGGKWRGR